MNSLHDYPYLILSRRRGQELINEAQEEAMARNVNTRRAAAGGAAEDKRTTVTPRLPEQWNVTRREVTAEYPCDRLGEHGVRRLTRGIDVDAPAGVSFRWLCQLRVAPYSYDWIDNLGRRSPRTLTPGADELATGQDLMIGRITDFAIDDHITGRAYPRAERLYGLVGLTYRVFATSPTTSRLVVRLVVHEPTVWWETLRYWLLAWGDLIMMRKQLTTLKSLAERPAGGPPVPEAVQEAIHRRAQGGRR